MICQCRKITGWGLKKFKKCTLVKGPPQAVFRKIRFWNASLFVTAVWIGILTSEKGSFLTIRVRDTIDLAFRLQLFQLD